MRFSRYFRSPDDSAPDDSALPIKRVLIWALVGAAILLGLVLYFLYARLLEPLIA